MPKIGRKTSKDAPMSPIVEHSESLPSSPVAAAAAAAGEENNNNSSNAKSAFDREPQQPQQQVTHRKSKV